MMADVPPTDPTTLLLLALAGVLTGIVGYAAGLASLVSFPALLAAGLPPLTANLTNTVALIGTTLGGVGAARRELVAVRRHLVPYGLLAVAGGAVGAALLLVAPPTVFEKVVPWLVLLGSVVLLASPWLRSVQAGRITYQHPGVTITIGLVCVYGGYFGAGAGVLVLAVLSAVLEHTLAELTALRTFLLGCANLVAAVIFAVTGGVAWPQAISLGLGAIAGAAMGPSIMRRVPERPARIVVAIAGIGLAVKLFLDYY